MLKINPLDQFFTPDHVADYCVNFFKEVTGETDIKVLEPCAGGKAFIRAFESQGYSDYRMLDLDPQSPDIQQQDFLKFEESLTGTAVITNPPFGRMSGLSIKFFNKAAELRADYIAMLTLANHGIDRFVNQMNAYYELLDEVYIKADFLTPEGESMNMKQFTLVFQVWRRSEAIRPLIKRKKWIWDSDSYDDSDFWFRVNSPSNEIFLELEEVLNNDKHFQSKTRRAREQSYSMVRNGETRWLSCHLRGLKKLPEVSFEDVRKVIELTRGRVWIGYYFYPNVLNQLLDEYYSGKSFKTKQF